MEINIPQSAFSHADRVALGNTIIAAKAAQDMLERVAETHGAEMSLASQNALLGALASATAAVHGIGALSLALNGEG
jgi:hypothetical protein